MKKLLLLFFILTFTSLYSLKAQAKLTITSDSTAYSYGQPITLTIEILNNTDSTLSFYSCPGAVYKFDEFDISNFIICVGDPPEFFISPGRSATWIWTIDPSKFGIPKKNGEHIVIGYNGSMTDTIIISAPLYFGGIVMVGYVKAKENEVALIKDSLNVYVISRNEFGTSIDEIWQIKGHLIDSVISKYKNDQRFRYVEQIINACPDSIFTLVEENSPAASINDFKISEAFPNPFNPVTNFYVEVNSQQNILIELFNPLGQKVKTIYNGMIPAKRKTYFNVNLNGYSSGIYLIYVMRKNNTFVRKIFLMK